MDGLPVVSDPIVSVVMSVRNGERFLNEAVDSILGQTFRDFEFIAIDDGSIDQSGAILDCYKEKDRRMRIYHQENRGLVRSLNRGCAFARGKYIARMDADDIAVRDRLLWQVEFMETHPEIVVLGGAVEFIDEVGKVFALARHPTQNQEIQRALLNASVFWHPSVLLRKSTFVWAGGYRSIVDAEDYDLWLRIADRFELANLTAVVLRYRIHPDQVSVARCKSQALGSAAARAAALARRSGATDPLDLVGEITPALLAKLGVSNADQQTTLARGCLSCLRNMCRIRKYSLATNVLEDFLFTDFRDADNWVIAEFYLWAAWLYWHQRKFAKSISSASRALVKRPIILGHLIKLSVARFWPVLVGR